jgi:hypothetical protein
VEVSRPNASRRRALGGRLLAFVAMVGVLALAALIARELFPHHAASHGRASEVAAVSVVEVATPRVALAAPTKPPRAPDRGGVPRGASPTPGDPAPASSPAAIPLAASIIAQVAANPQAFVPSTVFAPPAAREQVYNYEPLPPFNSTTLKRTRTNPSAWELDAMRGPKMNDLGPEGAVRQAALVRDAIGNETPWFAIDSGPLAPAFAVMQGSAMRVMSRAFLLENRGSLPPEVASALDK